MKDEKSKKRRTKSVVSGKGFYAALAACLVVTCAAGWAVISSSRSKTSGFPVQSDVLTSRGEEPSTGSGLFVFSEAPEYSPVISDSVSEEKPHPEETRVPSEPDYEEPEIASPETSEEADAPETPVFETLEFDESLPAFYAWPLKGSIDTPFSVNALVYDITMNDWRTHNGIDISAAAGAKVSAVADGTVSRVYNDDMYGTTVTISHSGGLESTYSNLAAAPTVSEGDAVAVGDVIGSVGNTALAESGMGSHLHLAFRLNGVPVDPRDYLSEQ